MRRRLSVVTALAVLAATVLAGAGAGGPAAAAPAASDDRWALVIGITKYKPRTKPTAAGASDARDMQRLLLARGFRSDRIMTLTEGEATLGSVRRGLQWLVDHSSPTSFSVLHFSGHVKLMSGDRDKDGEKVDEFLWLQDNTFMSDAELSGWARRLRGEAWVNIAGCEAAGFDEGISSPRRVFTGSSLEPEKSYEYPPWDNSIFVGLLEQAFLEGAGDTDHNGRVSIQEALHHAAPIAARMTARQPKGPQHPVLAGGDGEPWYLEGPPPPRAPAPPGPGGGIGGDQRPAPLCVLDICLL